jgi:hypothetical protein
LAKEVNADPTSDSHVEPILNELVAAGKYIDPATYRKILGLTGEL